MPATNERNGTPRPNLILAHPDEGYTAAVRRSFRRLHWAIHLAPNADEVRRLARLHGPELIVLAANLPGESGWLTCDKLRAELPGVKIALVVAEPTPYLERFAQFVGAAALVSVHSAPAALLDLVAQPAVA